jgi:hypothetical protein
MQEEYSSFQTLVNDAAASGAKPDITVRCEQCDCVGPWAVTARIAVQLWNEGFEGSRSAAHRRNPDQPQAKNRRSGSKLRNQTK